ncbi:MAG: hypothetical protein ABS36_08985 [Acidobacteria bacterium SCN 69-37]|nr:MAG: hypothetical protein ABS36_08985 [Acidobacteria bacterium SCN 69-37]
MNKLLGVLVLALSLAGAGCSQVDLSKALSVTDVFTGYYHVGVVDEINNKMVPSVTFKLANVGDTAVSRVQLMVGFWQVGADGLELDSKQIEGVGPTALEPGASTEALLVRSEKGYTLSIEAPREQMFENSVFRDVTVKLFARRDGRLVSLGEFPVERRLIPSASTGAPTAVPDVPVAPVP